MKRADELFEVIKAMTTQERRTFEQRSSFLKRDKKYLKLFKVLSSLESYDEKKLRSILAGEPMLRALHVAKHYLFELVLDFLATRSLPSSVAAKLSIEVNKIEILWDRGLFKQFNFRMKKQKKIAERIESFDNLLRIIDGERKLVIRNIYTSSSDLVKELSHQQKAIFTQLMRQNEYKELDDISKIDFAILGPPRDKSAAQKIKKFLSQALLMDYSMATTFLAKEYYHIVRGRCHYRLRNLPEAKRNATAAVSLFEDYPEWKTIAPFEHLSALTWLYISLYSLEEYSEAEKTLKVLQGIPEYNPYFGAYAFQLISSYEVHLIVQKKEVSELKEFILRTRSQIKKYSHFIDHVRMSVLNFGLSYAHFALGDYEKALVYLNEIFNEFGHESISDFPSALRLYNLVLHYELGHKEYIRYASRSTSQYLRRRKQLSKGEKAVIILLKALSSASSAEKKLESLKSFCEYATRLSNNPMEANFTQLFDIISWAEDKKKANEKKMKEK